MITRCYTRQIGRRTDEGLVMMFPPAGASSQPKIGITLGDHTVVQISSEEAEEVVLYLRQVTSAHDSPGPDVHIPLGSRGVWLVIGPARAYRLRVALDDVLGHLAAAQLAEAANG
ncbi:hypothetical protein [Natronospira bacteriovora]|uniref:Uncharacterized protein n=1 Tax=Natronospira bacteriovora TaxID=3069753 RepID=A0ABU0W8F9_9GAMM|nr:hypothetical protein [Natronospira sp. AB-CW4]MDQ2069285.1 hypothetical protein [Natronospira sp. AB-CW4]